MKERKLFRFVGGKGHLVDRVAPMIRAHLDVTKGRLISPFYGSGAIEQAVGGQQIAADLNHDLIDFWLAVRDVGSFVLDAALDLDEIARRGGKRTRATYRAVQGAQRMRGSDARAARFLWLQTFCFNGLWRVNRAGNHNVPPDPARLAKRSPFPDTDLFTSASRRLQNVDLDRSHYHRTLERAVQGDLVLVDPPYGSFDGYTAGGFDQHKDLASRLRDLAADGVAIVAFNAPEAAPLYAPWSDVTMTLRSGRVSSNGASRADVGELLITAGLQAAAERAA